MSEIMMHVTKIRPTQLYISQTKYQRCLEQFGRSGRQGLEPIPIKRIGKDIFFTDGHTRALVLHQKGYDRIQVRHDADDLDWIMYLVDLEWCRGGGIMTIGDLESRIVAESEYREKWIRRCDRKHTRLEKRPLRDLEVCLEKDPDKKAATCREIVQSLPEWFAINKIVEHHIEMARALPFVCASLYGKVVGFAALKPHHRINCEIYAMGVFREFHRRGIGKAIITEIEDYCRARGAGYVTVKTVGEASRNAHYAATRRFYQAPAGFKELEGLDGLWQEPCLYMLKPMDHTVDGSPAAMP